MLRKTILWSADRHAVDHDRRARVTDIHPRHTVVVKRFLSIRGEINPALVASCRALSFCALHNFRRKISHFSRFLLTCEDPLAIGVNNGLATGVENRCSGE